MEKTKETRTFIKALRTIPKLTKQQIKTLKGQALAGDLDGAFKGLRRIQQRGMREQRTKEATAQ